MRIKIKSVPKYPGGGPVNKAKLTEWNGFVDFLDARGYKGSPQLDIKDKNMGQTLFNQYKQAYPNSSLGYEDVMGVQQALQSYRDYNIAQIKAGKLKVTGDVGANYENYMSGLSKPDGWLGSKTSSWKFPSQYLQSVDTFTGSNETTNQGLIGDNPPTVKMADGGIHIKPENKGKFTRWAKNHSMGVQEAASKVMANKSKYSPSVVKMANFAKNFGGKKAMGGMIPEYAEGGFDAPNGTPYPDVFKNIKYRGKQYTAPQGLTPTQFYNNPFVIEQLRKDQTFPKQVDDSQWGPEHQRVYDLARKQNQIGAPVTMSPTLDQVNVGAPPDYVGDADPNLAPPSTPNIPAPAPPINTQGPKPATSPDRPDNLFSDTDYMSIYNTLTSPIRKYYPERVQLDYTPNRWYDVDLTAQKQAVKGQAGQVLNAQAMFATPQSAASNASSVQGNSIDALNQINSQEFNTNQQGRYQTQVQNNAMFDQVNNQNKVYSAQYRDQVNSLNQNTDDAKAYRRQQFLLAYQNAVKNRTTRQLLNELSPNFQIGRNYDVAFQANPDIFQALINRNSGSTGTVPDLTTFSNSRDAQAIKAMYTDPNKATDAILREYNRKFSIYNAKTRDWNNDGTPD